MKFLCQFGEGLTNQLIKKRNLLVRPQPVKFVTFRTIWPNVKRVLENELLHCTST